MNMEELKFKDVSDKLIGAFYKVYNVLEYGFLNIVYDNNCKTYICDIRDYL